MYIRIVSTLFLFFITTFALKAQIFPKEGSLLSYRIVGFSFPAETKAGKYTIEIARGTYNSQDSFEKNMLLKVDCDASKQIVELPSFGAEYTWRVTGKKNSVTRAGLHHFSTGIIPEVNNNTTRFRIVKSAEQYTDAFIFLDGCRALYDTKGNPVWYLPEIDGSNATPVDLKMTTQGTITFILNNRAYEINYDGEVLWKDPHNGRISGDSLEHFHHQLTRLANGNYMVMGIEMSPWKMGEDPQHNNIAMMGRLPFGTLIEYDKQGNLIWSWKSSAYFQKSDVLNYQRPEGKPGIDVHENGFFFDEKTKAVYVSFRDISRIVKINYPDGTILNSYGEVYTPGTPEKGNGQYCGQHSPAISQDGNLYLFDNNYCNGEFLPKIKVFREPLTNAEGLKKTWEYDCRFRPGDTKPASDYHSSTGGNVVELPDHSFFVSMGNIYGEIFIVTPDKKIVWSGFPEKLNAETKKWDLVYQYRANIITDRKALEQLIWNRN